MTAGSPRELIADTLVKGSGQMFFAEQLVNQINNSANILGHRYFLIMEKRFFLKQSFGHWEMVLAEVGKRVNEY
jgi:hypothetical protein